jgi:hypothetical protein
MYLQILAPILLVTVLTLVWGLWLVRSEFKSTNVSWVPKYDASAFQFTNVTTYRYEPAKAVRDMPSWYVSSWS